MLWGYELMRLQGRVIGYRVWVGRDGRASEFGRLTVQDKDVSGAIVEVSLPAKIADQALGEAGLAAGINGDVVVRMDALVSLREFSVKSGARMRSLSLVGEDLGLTVGRVSWD